MARHCVARTSRTCVVPMPKAMAPTAPWVEVWLSPQAMVMPGWLSPSSGPITWTMPCLPLAMSKSGRPNSFMFRYMCWAISSACGSAKGRAWSSVGMMWSSVPNVRSGMRTLSFSSLSIWKACGVVTSWIRWRPIRSWVWPDGSVRTVCASHTLSSSVRAMEILREGYRAPSSAASPPLDAPRSLMEYRGDELWRLASQLPAPGHTGHHPGRGRPGRAARLRLRLGQRSRRGAARQYRQFRRDGLRPPRDARRRRRGDPPGPARHHCPHRPVSQRGRHRQDDRLARRALRRARRARHRRRLGRRRERRPGRALRGARRHDRRVSGGDARALDQPRAVVRGQVHAVQRARVRAQAPTEAAPANLGRRPQPGRAPPRRSARSRLASDQSPAGGAAGRPGRDRTALPGQRPRDASGAHAAQRPARAAAPPARASVPAWRARARGRAGRPGRADRRAGRVRRRAPGPRVPRRRRPRARRADGRLRRERAARARVSPSPTLLRCPSPGSYAAPRGVEPMGTFFVEALLAAALLRALSVVPTERHRVVTIEGQVAERDAAGVLITLEGRTLVDPVQRKLIPALQYGAANGH